MGVGDFSGLDVPVEGLTISVINALDYVALSYFIERKLMSN